MGYRSDVALCLTQNGVSTLSKKLDNSNAETKNLVTDLMEYPREHFKDADTGSEIWYWDMVKWYSEYPDVSFIENLISELDYTEYLFIRMGEDTDDNEIQGSYWDNPFGLHLSRTIDFSE